MANIRTACRSCTAVVLLWPAQVLLVQTQTDTSGRYLFFCPSCGRITVNQARPVEILLLLAAGVPLGSGGCPCNPGVPPRNPQVETSRPKGEQP